jgi:hypothetical protein
VIVADVPLLESLHWANSGREILDNGGGEIKIPA